jgi:hypothetical protein
MKILRKPEYRLPAKRVAIESVDEDCISAIETVHTRITAAANQRVKQLMLINTSDYDLAV